MKFPLSQRCLSHWSLTVFQEYTSLVAMKPVFWVCRQEKFTQPTWLWRSVGLKIECRIKTMIFYTFVASWAKHFYSCLVLVQLRNMSCWNWTLLTCIYWHFQSKPLINLKIFVTVHSLINDVNLIDSCQDHLPVQYPSNIEFFCQKWHWCCDWRGATPELHVLVCSIGCPYSHWLFGFSFLHSNKTINMIRY